MSLHQWHKSLWTRVDYDESDFGQSLPNMTKQKKAQRAFLSYNFNLIMKSQDNYWFDNELKI